MKQNNKVNILVISHNYFPAIGGAEKLLQSIAENLKGSGYRVEVLTSNAKNAAMYFNMHPETVGQAREIINRVQIYREDIRNIIQKISKVFWSIFIKNSSKNEAILPILIGPHYFKFLIKYIFSKNKYTHIIAGPFPTTVPFYGYLLKLFSPNCKLILYPCLHVDDPMHKGRLLQLIAKKADFILTLTKEETKMLIDWGINKKTIIETGVAVDEEILKNKKNTIKINALPVNNYILFLGQEVEHKNILHLIDAMQILWNDGYKQDLVIAGAKTNYSGAIDEKIHSLNVDFQKRILRINDFTEEEKIHLLDGCQVLVLPSSFESFGIVIIEAWARKKPVVASDIPAIKSLIKNNVDGLLFSNRDYFDLSKKLKFVLSDKKFSKKIGDQGYKKVTSNYTRSAIFHKLNRVLI